MIAKVDEKLCRHQHLSIQAPEIHWHQLTNSWLLHRNSIYHVHSCHCLLIVGHYDELGIVRELADHVGELAYVGVIQWRIHFIKDTEWGWLDEIDRKQKGCGGQGLFSTAQLGEGRGFLALWLRVYL